MKTACGALCGLTLCPLICTAQNQPPVAIATADPTTILVGEQVCFDGSQSYDPEEQPLTYRWTQMLGELSTLVSFCRSFDEVGSFTVALRVTDDAGQWDIAFVSIDVLPPTGACCVGTVCSITTAAGCAGVFQGVKTACGPSGNPTTCCAANFNQAGGVSVQDLFDFLAAYFANDPRADINKSGLLSVQDIFDFLAAYFAGCGST